MMLKLNNKYNDMLILFLILLGLLTLTSAIGGGIKLQENFWEDIAVIAEEHKDNEEESGDHHNNVHTILNNDHMHMQSEPLPPTSFNKPINVSVDTIVHQDKTIEGFEGNMYAGCS